MNQFDLSILFAGDYHIYGDYRNVKGPFGNFIKDNPEHDLFTAELVNIIKGCDLGVFNLENPISLKKKGIKKYGPHGVGPKEALISIKKAGFKLATFATNHTSDMDSEGVKNTIRECRKLNIDVIGAGLNEIEAKRILYKTIKGFSIAFVNYSRIEYNIVNDSRGGANPLSIIDNTRDILEAKRKADFVFVVVHEGLDVNPLPYPNLVKQMRFYADMGASAVIMHHSRVVSGYEIYNGVPIFYGIGNMVHLTKNEIELKGLFIKFNISSYKNLTFEIIPVELDKEKVIVRCAHGNQAKEILNGVNQMSDIIQNKNKLEVEWDKYVLSQREFYLSIILGHPRLLYKIAKKFKLLGIYYKFMVLNKKKYYLKLNIYQCEAHFQTTKSIIRKLLESP